VKRLKPQAMIQIAVSAVLIALLLYLAHRHHVWTQIAREPRWAIAAAAGLICIDWVINSFRWNLLLRVAGVVEKQRTLTCLYFIATFCTQLLPTGTGGDAVRIYDIARRRGQTALVIVATLQERLIGMATAMGIGLVAVALNWQRLPIGWRPVLIVLPSLAIAVVAVLIYPKIPAAIAAWIWKKWPAARRWEQKPIVRKIITALRPAASAPALTPLRLAPVIAVTVIAALMSFAVFWVLGYGAGIGVPFSGYCLVVPLVWVIAMAPSVGGAGVREGGFVLLMEELFAVGKEKSLAVAALFLVIQTAVAGIGGVMLVMRAPSWRKMVAEVSPAIDATTTSVPPTASARE